MIVMMIVMDRGTIVILLGMSERLLRLMSIVRHVLLILVVGVMSFVS